VPVELHNDAVRVLLVPEAGGRIGQIEVGGRDLLRGPEHAHLGWGWWGSYPLLPWSNRIPGGRFTFEGRQLEVPVSWSDGSALHGLAARVPWRVTEHEAQRVAMDVHVTDGCYDVAGRQRFELAADGLVQSLEVENLGGARVPVGLGIHPWFAAGPVRVPAALRWPGDGPMPTGEPVPVGADDDLRTARVPPPMDRCYTGLEEASADVPGIRLSWSGPVSQVVVFSEAEGWVCVEPVTMANDGFALAAAGVDGTGVIALDPGASTRVTYRFGWRSGAVASSDG
jgi:aldose 1-epimerase